MSGALTVSLLFSGGMITIVLLLLLCRRLVCRKQDPKPDHTQVITCENMQQEE